MFSPVQMIKLFPMFLSLTHISRSLFENSRNQNPGKFMNTAIKQLMTERPVRSSHPCSRWRLSSTVLESFPQRKSSISQRINLSVWDFLIVCFQTDDSTGEQVQRAGHSLCSLTFLLFPEWNCFLPQMCLSSLNTVSYDNFISIDPLWEQVLLSTFLCFYSLPLFL